MSEITDPNFDYVPTQDGDGDSSYQEPPASGRGGDRMSCVINHDGNGNVSSAQYGDGNSIDYQYDQNGHLVSVTDTSSGSQMQHRDDGWYITTPNGTTKIDGTVDVDPSNGDIRVSYGSGASMTYGTDGSVQYVSASTGGGGDRSSLK